MKTIKYILTISLLLLLASCSQDEMAVVENETVTVTVSAALPQPATRGEAYTLVVNKIVCAVFDKCGKEIKNLRDTIDVSESIIYTPSLALNQTYDVVLFAYYEDKKVQKAAYNIADLTAISRNAEAQLDEEYFEAFAACQGVTVNNKNMEIGITLKRAVAKINIGVTETDLTDATALGMTPTSTEITVADALTTYNALSPEEEPKGESKPLTFTSKADFADLSVESNFYKRLGYCYFFTDGGIVKVTCDFKAENGESIRGNALTVENVPVGKNHLTSLVGNMLTATVNYSISFGEAFEKDNTVPVP